MLRLIGAVGIALLKLAAVYAVVTFFWTGGTFVGLLPPWIMLGLLIFALWETRQRDDLTRWRG